MLLVVATACRNGFSDYEVVVEKTSGLRLIISELLRFVSICVYAFIALFTLKKKPGFSFRLPTRGVVG